MSIDNMLKSYGYGYISNFPIIYQVLKQCHLWYDMSPIFINSFYLLILILSNLNVICNVTMLCAFKAHPD